MYKSSVNTGFEKQIMPVLRILCYNGSLVTWTVVSMTTAKLKPHIFLVWLGLVLYREHVDSHDSLWLLLVAGTILLYNWLSTRLVSLLYNLGTDRIENTGSSIGPVSVAAETFLLLRYLAVAASIRFTIPAFIRDVTV
jgi:hypothetical protein